MKVLHLASFVGNIGDIANHEALYIQLKSLLNCELEIDKLEMRLFYYNTQQKKFDEKFAELVNSYDLFVIGGGNFFELCWDYSETGTTFNISREVLTMIDTPILINGIGVDIDKGYSEDNIKKFKVFLNTLFTSNKVFFTVRNDGSKKVIDKFFGEYSENIFVVPDHGFFIKEVPKISDYSPDTSKNYIGVNVAIDMKEIRYKNLDYNIFIEELAEILNGILDKYNIDIYLFPHIQSDYLAIVDLMKHIKNYYLRTRISITPLIVGNELESFKYYKECKIVLGMRNHSTICAVGLGVPSFGMTSYPKPEYIYSEIGLEDRYLNIADEKFFTKLNNELQSILENNFYNIDIINRYQNTLVNMLKQRDEVYDLLNTWFIKHNLK